MQELSLNILDIAQNSVAAQATLVTISLRYTLGDTDRLYIDINDNGRGMSEEVAKNVTDPFYTTRTTRKVGMGTSLFKLAAEMAEGCFELRSRSGVGTTVHAELNPRHLDAMPLGDIAATYAGLVQTSPEMDFVLEITLEKKGEAPRSLTADTRVFREILQGVPINSPEVIVFIGDYIRENLAEVFGLEQGL